MQDLSTEVLLHICDYLRFEHIVRLSQVSKQLKSLCQETKEWDRFYIPTVQKVTQHGRYAVRPYVKRDSIVPTESIRALGDWCWCDFCMRFDTYAIPIPTEDDESPIHNLCEECGDLYCQRLTSKEYCIKCLHKLKKTKCCETWATCRTQVEVIDGTFSCLLLKCSICSKRERGVVSYKFRDPLTMTVVWRDLCNECWETRTHACLCLNNRCSCKRRGVRVLGEPGATGVVCDYCRNYHCTLYELPRYALDVNLDVWKKYAFSLLDWKIVVNELLKVAAGTSGKTEKLKVAIVIFTIMYLRKLVIFGNPELQLAPNNIGFRLTVERTINRNISEINGERYTDQREQLIQIKEKLVSFFGRFSKDAEIVQNIDQFLPPEVAEE